jgi:hypothetical protein
MRSWIDSPRRTGAGLDAIAARLARVSRPANLKESDRNPSRRVASTATTVVGVRVKITRPVSGALG